MIRIVGKPVGKPVLILLAIAVCVGLIVQSSPSPIGSDAVYGDSRIPLPNGVAAGEVTGSSAVLWARSDRTGKLAIAGGCQARGRLTASSSPSHPVQEWKRRNRLRPAQASLLQTVVLPAGRASSPARSPCSEPATQPRARHRRLRSSRSGSLPRAS